MYTEVSTMRCQNWPSVSNRSTESRATQAEVGAKSGRDCHHTSKSRIGLLFDLSLCSSKAQRQAATVLIYWDCRDCFACKNLLHMHSGLHVVYV